MNDIHVALLVQARELLAQQPLTRARFEEAQHNLTILSSIRVRSPRYPLGERLRVFEQMLLSDDSPASVRRTIATIDGLLAMYGQSGNLQVA